MFKIRSLLLPAVATMLFTSVFADNRGNYNYSARNADSNDSMSGSGKRSSRQKMDGTKQCPTTTITPDAGPRVSNGIDLAISADFIYWSTKQDGMSYAETGTTTGLGVISANAGSGSVRHVKQKWEPGFKVALGFNTSHDGWDIIAQYTWLRSSPGTRSVSRDPAAVNAGITNNIKATWQTQGVVTALSQDLSFASGKWRFRFNVIDAELGRNFYVSRFLTMRPFVGFKGTWQTDDLRVRYQGALITQGADSESRMKNDVDYWGLGIRAGLNNAWYFMRNFCLFGDMALTALWGRFEVDRVDTVTPNLAVPDTTFVNRYQSNNFYTVKPVLELTIGLRYDVWWSNDNYHFGFQAGWEEQVWFSHNQHYAVLEEGAHGDLVFQGLTVKVRFDF